eukprot:CAMPEP_0175110948 /NCGR_PEP_ID=MMETSP0086_2-20121207/14443_1 /TAXON_ID=136419 /ORGANISM="Unknown Unknown, Strain D1" /LENGTH=61 /DNA_ID=CAMNT_0016389261 /DNA_START=426 /DNA_END=611 /DNA_ORIENTATION=+
MLIPRQPAGAKTSPAPSLDIESHVAAPAKLGVPAVSRVANGPKDPKVGDKMLVLEAILVEK